MPGAETEQKTTEEVQKQEEEKTPVEQMKEKVAEEGNFFQFFFDTFSKVEKLKPKMVTPRPTRKRKKKNQPLKGMA